MSDGSARTGRTGGYLGQAVPYITFDKEAPLKWKFRKLDFVYKR